MHNDIFQEASEFVNSCRDEIIKDMKKLISVNSVRSESTPCAPFGEGPRLALLTVTDICRSRGLETKDFTVCTEAEVKGRDSRTVGIITHTDVVPAGEGWDSDPFTLTKRDGWLVGRGICDDKGPAVLSIWCAKFFNDKKCSPEHSIRLIFGSDEESGMSDLPVYLSSRKAPDFTFTPDGTYPVCNGEKGSCRGAFFFHPGSKSRIAAFSSGTAFNIVPASACMQYKGIISYTKLPEFISVSTENGMTVIKAKGTPAHASTPEKGVSAAGRLCRFVLDNAELCDEDRRFLEFELDLALSYDGSAFGIDCKDSVFTPLTIIGGTAQTQKGTVGQSFDCRYPPCADGEQIVQKLKTAADNAGLSMSDAVIDPPFYISPENNGIKSLLCTYERVTGNKARTFVMGGGTYARHLPDAVSFGIEDPGMVFPEWAGRMHESNEAFPEQALMDDLVLMICAVNDLMDTDI